MTVAVGRWSHLRLWSGSDTLHSSRCCWFVSGTGLWVGWTLPLIQPGRSCFIADLDLIEPEMAHTSASGWGG